MSDDFRLHQIYLGLGAGSFGSGNSVSPLVVNPIECGDNIGFDAGENRSFFVRILSSGFNNFNTKTTPVDAGTGQVQSVPADENPTAGVILFNPRIDPLDTNSKKGRFVGIRQAFLPDLVANITGVATVGSNQDNSNFVAAKPGRYCLGFAITGNDLYMVTYANVSDPARYSESTSTGKLRLFKYSLGSILNTDYKFLDLDTVGSPSNGAIENKQIYELIEKTNAGGNWVAPASPNASNYLPLGKNGSNFTDIPVARNQFALNLNHTTTNAVPALSVLGIRAGHLMIGAKGPNEATYILFYNLTTGLIATASVDGMTGVFGAIPGLLESGASVFVVKLSTSSSVYAPTIFDDFNSTPALTSDKTTSGWPSVVKAGTVVKEAKYCRLSKLSYNYHFWASLHYDIDRNVFYHIPVPCRTWGSTPPKSSMWSPSTQNGDVPVTVLNGNDPNQVLGFFFLKGDNASGVTGKVLAETNSYSHEGKANFVPIRGGSSAILSNASGNDIQGLSASGGNPANASHWLGKDLNVMDPNGDPGPSHLTYGLDISLRNFVLGKLQDLTYNNETSLNKTVIVEGGRLAYHIPDSFNPMNV